MKIYKKITAVFLSAMITFMYMTCCVMSADATSKMILYFKLVEASAGQDIQLNMYADNIIAIQKIENLRLSIPDGFEVTGIDETSPAFNGNVTYSVTDNYLNFNISSNGTLNSDSDIVATINMHISENCTAGRYDFMWASSYFSCITSQGNNYTPTLTFGRVVVGDSSGTVTSTTTTSTTTSTTTTTFTETTPTTTTTAVQKHKYSVKFVDGESGEYVSGVKYNVVSYDTVHDVAYPIRTSSYSPDYFEFISDTAYVELSKVIQAIPDGYYINNGATRWDLSADNPDLTVYLDKINTTTTTATVTTTGTTTTVSTYYEIIIDSLPTKTVYEIGEELDFTGGKYHEKGQDIHGSFEFLSANMTSNLSIIDTSEFDNTKAGTYRIYIRNYYDNMFAETYFEVTVEDIQTTTTTTTTDTTTITTTASTYMNINIYSYPTKMTYKIGEEIDLSGGSWYISGVKSDGIEFVTTTYDMVSNNNFIDTSEFDNSKAGTYKIFIRMQYEELSAETYFEVTVSSDLKLGDLNNDNIIDSIDASLILTEYSIISTSGTGTFTSEQKQCADINNDNIIDAVDASLVLSYYAYISTGGSDSISEWLIYQ